ncbi:MAG: adenosylmethionine decarboxylase [Chloroflexi bacterium]|nr:adenosylmethionine decarboxylase [Chloroflexota bacterium]
MNALGYHLLLEMKDCNRELLNDPGRLERLLVDAANQAGATVVQKAFHHFNPHGVSGVVIIAESHLFIHTWPEHGYAAVDIFTCGDTVRADKAAEWLADKMGTTNFSMIELRRGVLPGVPATR